MSSRKYYEHVLSLHQGDLKYETLFTQSLTRKYFTVEGLKLFCELNNVDCTGCVTKRDFYARIYFL